MAARKTSNVTEQPVDLAAIYTEIEVTLSNSATKEYGKYLPFKWYRTEVAEAIKFLCSKHTSVPTAVVRQFVAKILESKIAAFPDGNDRVFDEMGRIREEVTKSELKARLQTRLAASSRSSNPGPTITRNLCSPSNKDWLRKNHGIICVEGQWGLVSEQKDTAKQEEESS